MSYVVMARRYRPQTFDEVVGQEAIARTLKNAVRLDRIGHAFLFAGPRGVGKTSTARILAKALNCEKGPTEDPCNKCQICLSISSGADMDVVEIDAASNNSVDDIRALRENVQYATSRARYKVYIIDEVHMLSNSAFNALLRTLEEPPEHVKFIFATTEPSRLPETVRSRCQRFDFRPVGIEAIVGRLKEICKTEKIKATDEALAAVARRARGSMRDSQSLLDQLVTYAEGKIELSDVEEVTGSVGEASLFAIAAAVASGDPKAALAAADDVLDGGGDAADLLDELAAVFHAGLEVSVLGGAESARPEFSHRAEELGSLAGAMGSERLLYAVKLLSTARIEAAESPRPHIPLEVAIIKLARIDDLVDLARLVDDLSSGGADGAGIAAPAARSKPARSGDAPPSKAPPGPKSASFSGELSLESARAAWDAVIDKVSSISVPAGTILKEGELTAVDGKSLTISFDRKKSFHKEHLEESERRKMIGQAASDVFGRDVELRFVMASGGKGASAPQGKKPPRAARDRSTIMADPGVGEVLKRFDGEVLKVELREETE